MRSHAAFVLLVLLGGPQTAARPAPPSLVSVRVVEATTGAPIANGIVTVGNTERRTDANGVVAIERAPAAMIRARAAGYLRAVAPAPGTGSTEIRLTPFHPKALYLSVYGIGSTSLRTAALHLIDTTELNALVIDVKGDRGIVPYRSAIPLAATIGAQRVITIPDLPQLVAQLKERGIYTIARLVLFKDDKLASARSDLALHRRDGSLFRDREGLAWADPDKAEVRAYNIALAVEAARAGFDEIQFDYVRLPDATGLLLSRPSTEENRVATIDGFLVAARQALVPYNTFLAADIFGYVCWNTNDTHIGQKLEHIAPIVDYTSPMLYPSGFQFGIPGYRQPLDHPDRIVRLSLERAVKRTGLPSLHFRPWLQAFRDYAFGGRACTAGMIRQQIAAAEAAGSDGWMVWNPQNRYPAEAFRPQGKRPVP
jgi:hypothetical protein